MFRLRYMFEYPHVKCYLSMYFSLFLSKTICLIKYTYRLMNRIYWLMNKGFIVFIFLTQWSVNFHIKSNSMQTQNDRGNWKLIFEMNVFTKVPFRNWTTGGKRIVFHTNSYLLKASSCKQCPLRQQLLGITLLCYECWLIHIVMSFFLTRVWTYNSFLLWGTL